LVFFTTNFKEVTFIPSQKQEKKISLNLKQIGTPKPTPKPVVPKPMPKPKPLVRPPAPPKPIVEKVIPPKPKPETIKRKTVTESKKTFAIKDTKDNNVTKIEKKPEKKKKVVKKKPEKKMPKKVVKKKIPKKKKPKRSKDALANALMGSGTAMFPQRSRPSKPSTAGAYGQQMINRLYGSEFDSYTPTQKKFIQNNLGIIHRITQHTLNINGYPDIAARTGQQGTNIVSFYLHPNGDISGLRLRRDIGHQALDQNTLEVIRIAYKDYPLPNKKTRIIFHVQYSLY
jgi:periplasmic protein TonB